MLVWYSRVDCYSTPRERVIENIARHTIMPFVLVKFRVFTTSSSNVPGITDVRMELVEYLQKCLFMFLLKRYCHLNKLIASLEKRTNPYCTIVTSLLQDQNRGKLIATVDSEKILCVITTTLQEMGLLRIILKLKIYVYWSKPVIWLPLQATLNDDNQMHSLIWNYW